MPGHCCARVLVAVGDSIATRTDLKKAKLNREELSLYLSFLPEHSHTSTHCQLGCASVKDSIAEQGVEGWLYASAELQPYRRAGRQQTHSVFSWSPINPEWLLLGRSMWREGPSPKQL